MYLMKKPNRRVELCSASQIEDQVVDRVVVKCAYQTDLAATDTRVHVHAIIKTVIN